MLVNKLEKAHYLKSIIYESIKQNKLDNAEIKLNQYKKDYPFDLDIYSLQSILFLNKNDLINAKFYLEEGLIKNDLNLDLNINYAYILYLMNDIEKSLEFFYISYYIATDDTTKNNIKTNINDIIKNNNLSKSVTQPIHDKVFNDFNYNHRFFPVYGENLNYIGENFYINNRNYFVGIYDEYRTERDGFDLSLNHSLNQMVQLEILEIDNYKKYNFNPGAHNFIIPIAKTRLNQEVNFKYNDSIENLNRNLDKRFYYYKTEKTPINIESSDDFLVGKPIKLNGKKDNKLILNIFIDGLSQTLIEKYGLENLMPHTYNFFNKGCYCTNTYVTGEWTYVSMPSLFTGLYTTNHKMFHPDINKTLPSNISILSELFQKNNFFTSHISGEWRSTPSYGYIRGIDRFLYQSAMRGSNIKNVVIDTLEHIETFKETDLFMWIGINDLHDIADHLEGSIKNQTDLSLEHRFYNFNDLTPSARKRYDDIKVNKYIVKIKELDFYLKILYNYIENNFSDDKFLLSIISDHGQSFLIKENEHFFSDKRTKVPLLIRGMNVPTGKCDELISSIDLLPILTHLSNINDIDKSKRDSQLPRFFGGNKERTWTYTDSIHPNRLYRGAINTNSHTFTIESEFEAGPDGRFKLGKYNTIYFNKKTGLIDKISSSLEEDFLSIVFEHIKEYLII